MYCIWNKYYCIYCNFKRLISIYEYDSNSCWLFHFVFNIHLTVKKNFTFKILSPRNTHTHVCPFKTKTWQFSEKIYDICFSNFCCSFSHFIYYHFIQILFYIHLESQYLNVLGCHFLKKQLKNNKYKFYIVMIIIWYNLIRIV